MGEAYDSWFPAESGILEQIEAIHTDFPQGFRVGESANKDDDDADDLGQRPRSISQVEDLDSRERADFVVSNSRARSNWQKARKTVNSLRRQSLTSKTHGSVDLDVVASNDSFRAGRSAFGHGS